MNDDHYYYYDFNPCQAFQSYSSCINVHVSTDSIRIQGPFTVQSRSVKGQISIPRSITTLLTKEVKKYGLTALKVLTCITQVQGAGTGN